MRIYQTINTTQNEFPSEFIEAVGKKYVTVLNVSLIQEGENSTTTDKYYNHLNFFHLHASFVHQHDFLHNYVCEINSNKALIAKTYELARNERSFKIWFSDYAFREVKPSDGSYYFVVELLLEVK